MTVLTFFSPFKQWINSKHSLAEILVTFEQAPWHATRFRSAHVITMQLNETGEKKNWKQTIH